MGRTAGAVIGLAGPVSVHCDWVRQQVWSTTSTSLWQQVNTVQADPSLGKALYVAWMTNKQNTYTHAYFLLVSRRAML